MLRFFYFPYPINKESIVIGQNLTYAFFHISGRIMVPGQQKKLVSAIGPCVCLSVCENSRKSPAKQFSIERLQISKNVSECKRCEI